MLAWTCDYQIALSHARVFPHYQYGHLFATTSTLSSCTFRAYTRAIFCGTKSCLFGDNGAVAASAYALHTARESLCVGRGYTL